VEQRLLRQPVRLRVGADQEPGRCPAVDSRRWRRRRHGAGRARPGEDATRRRCSPPTSPCASTRPTRRSRAASSRTRTSSPTPSPGPGSSSRTATWVPRARYLGPEVPAEDAHLAGPDPRRRPPAGRRAGHRRAQGARCSTPGLAGLRARLHRLGLGLHLPRLRQARRRQRRPHSPGPAEGLGGQRARPNSPRCSPTLEAIQTRVQRRADRRQEGLARRPDRARPAAPASSRRRRRPVTTVTVPFTPGRTDATQEQTDVDSFAVLEPQRRRLPQLPQGPVHACSRRGAARRHARSC